MSRTKLLKSDHFGIEIDLILMDVRGMDNTKIRPFWD